jgi:hypothetical protein
VQGKLKRIQEFKVFFRKYEPVPILKERYIIHPKTFSAIFYKEKEKDE